MIAIIRRESSGYINAPHVTALHNMISRSRLSNRPQPFACTFFRNRTRYTFSDCSTRDHRGWALLRQQFIPLAWAFTRFSEYTGYISQLLRNCFKAPRRISSDIENENNERKHSFLKFSFARKEISRFSYSEKDSLVHLWFSIISWTDLTFTTRGWTAEFSPEAIRRGCYGRSEHTYMREHQPRIQISLESSGSGGYERACAFTHSTKRERERGKKSTRSISQRENSFSRMRKLQFWNCCFAVLPFDRFIIIH